MQALSRLTRDYYDAYPEICASDLSNPPPACEAPIRAELFDSLPRVMTVANPAPQRWRACIGLPGREAGMLLDRVSGQRVAVEAGHATLPLEPWGYAAYELRASSCRRALVRRSASIPAPISSIELEAGSGTNS